MIELPYPIGARFNLLTVVERRDADRFGRQQFLMRCDCGEEKVVALFRAKSGHTKSCGHIKGESRKRRGRGTPTYNSWAAMKQRCKYEAGGQYWRYGGQGVTVCERWDASFDSFLEDMGRRPPGTTLDRIDGARGYEPGNCRWASNAEQSRNRSSTILVTIDGQTRCVLDWCTELGLKADTVYKRIQRGASPLEALR